PPPPVPSTQAPTASDSMSSSESSRPLTGKSTGKSSSKHALEVDVIAEGARADVAQALLGEEHRRRRQGDHGDPLAVADGLGADRFAGHRIEHADQVG